MTRIQNVWLVTISVNIGILIFVPLQARHLVRWQALLITWISLLMMQVVCLVSLRNRLKQESVQLPKNFYRSATILALTTGLVTSIIVAQVAQPSSYIELANSKIPLSDIQSPQKRLVIELLRKDIAATNANNVALKNAKPVSPSLYSSASFASADVMQGTLDGLRSSVEQDKQYGDQLNSAEEDFRAKMAALDPGYLKDWDAKRKAERDAQIETMRIEALWWASMQDLYGYAESHANDIVIQGDNIGIRDEMIRSEFNGKFQASKDLYDALQKQMQVQVTIKQQAQ